MKGKFILTSALLLFTVSVSVKAQSDKNVTVTNFNSVVVSSGMDLYLTQSNSENIRVNAHPDLLKNVIIEKQGSTLIIRYKNNISWSRLFKGQQIKVYVNYKVLYEINASGGSDVYTQNAIKTDRLTAQASGGSDLKLNVDTKNIIIHASGGSDIDLNGNAANMEANASGGSDVNALKLMVEYAKVNASGGSDININVAKGLEAGASGGSDVKYKGNPSVKKTTSSKSGDVIRIN